MARTVAFRSLLHGNSVQRTHSAIFVAFTATILIKSQGQFNMGCYTQSTELLTNALSQEASQAASKYVNMVLNVHRNHKAY